MPFFKMKPRGRFGGCPGITRDTYPARRPEHVFILLDAQSGELLMSAINRYYGGDVEETAAFRDIGHGDRDFGAVQAAVRMGVLTAGGKLERMAP